MILFKTDNVGIPGSNCMMLEVEDIGYVYISKETYDQMVMLNDRFEGDTSILLDTLGVGDNQQVAIEYFTEVAPEPLSILAPFLAFISDNVELPAEFEPICGALHQISTTINFNEVTKVPKEIRASLNFSKSFISKYKDSWEAIEAKLVVTDVDVDNIKASVLEDMLSRILPMIKSNEPQTIIQQVQPIQQPAQSVLPYASDCPEPVVRFAVEPVTELQIEQPVQNDTHVEQEVQPAQPEDVESVVASILDNDFFSDMLDDDDEEEEDDSRETEDKTDTEEERIITPEEVIGKRDISNMSKEDKDAVYNEASKIAGLVNRFGGKRK